jgi:small multidrug resistance pump
MMGWLFLCGAILTEVAATLSLRASINGRKLWYAVVVSGYLAAFTLLFLALQRGLPLGIAYGVWAASGVALTAVLSKFVFKEPFTLLMTGGIALIAGGVLLVEIGASHSSA